MKAQVIPYSSIVGSSILVSDDAGNPVCQLAILNVVAKDPASHQTISTHLALKITEALNTLYGEPPHDNQPLI